MAIVVRIEVRRDAGKNVLVWPRGRVNVDAELAPTIDRLDPGLHDFTCEYKADGLRVRGVGGDGRAIQAPGNFEQGLAPEEARRRRLLQAASSNRWSEALALLVETGEARVQADPVLLMVRLQARIKTTAWPEAAEDFGRVMARGGVEPMALDNQLVLFPPAWQEKLVDGLLAWRASHAAVEMPASTLKPWLSRWPDALLFGQLQLYASRRFRDTTFSELITEAARRAPDDRRVAAARATIAAWEAEDARMAELARTAIDDRARQRLGWNATIDLLEAELRLRLPRELQRAIRERRAIGAIRLGVEGTLLAALEEIDRLSKQSFPGEGNRAFLPIGRDGDARIGLYTLPRAGGDFAVLRLAAGREPEVVAGTTWELLNPR
jgi:hypothetical protein